MNRREDWLPLDQDTAIFGELHGNKESPGRFLAAVCQQLQEGSQNVRIALELPSDMQYGLDAFFGSDGLQEDIRKLLDHSFWRRRQASQDGRSSAAIVDLIDDLRTLAARSGRLGALYAIDGRWDDRGIEYTGISRESVMASNISWLSRKYEEDVLFVLVGNIHAGRSLQSGHDYLKPMASLLDILFVNVLLLPQSGESWNCKVFCEAMPVAPISDIDTVIKYHTSDNSFDHVVPIGNVTSSPPACSDVSDLRALCP